MRFVWAVAAFVLATVMIGAGIAQRTVLQGPRTASQAIEVEQEAPFVLIDGAVLNSHDGAQTLRVQDDGTIFAAYARTADLQAWLARSDHVKIVPDGDTVRAEFVRAEQPAEGAEAVAPVPAGSDLWLDEFQQEDLLVTPLQLPEDMGLLVASDGVEPAPTDLSLTWPLSNPTPWAGPLIVGGIVFLVVGVVLYLLGLRHVRRSRGPRRKGLPMVPTEPIDMAEIEAADKGVISATPDRKKLLRGGRALIAAPVTVVLAAGLAGCSPEAWPQLGSSPTPSPTATVLVPEGQQSPAVTQAQAERILSRIAETVAAADASNDIDAAAARLAGPVLESRRVEYTLRTEIPERAAPAAVPTSPLSILLPQAYDAWPRTFLAVVEDEETKAATIMMVTQDDPWSDYKLAYAANLAADVQMPDLAPFYVGASQIPPDTAFLLLPPDQLAAAYSDVLENGDDSEFAALFDQAGDTFRTRITEDRAARLERFNQTGAETGELTFSSAAGDEAPVALATLESGAIVAVTIVESETVRSTNEDAVIKLDDEENPNLVGQTLSGVTQSATGFTTTYADQLFFYVPAAGATGKIQFLGWGSNILDMKEVSDQ